MAISQNSSVLDYESVLHNDNALESFYSNKRLLIRNVILIIFLTLGWSASFQLLNNLMLLRLKAHGVSNSTVGTLALANNWTYSILVMYFAWKSDHTRSRWGRRIPYLFISAPVIIGVVSVFSFVENTYLLISLWMLNCIFMDIKAATIPLLNIDCVPRHFLARANAISMVICSCTNFLSVRYGSALSDYNEHLPYLCCGILLIITTLTGGLLIKEPPVIAPPMKPFRPWSTMAVAWRDRRAIVLMFGVAMILTFSALFGQWIWIFAEKDLGLTKTNIGSALAWSILLQMALAFPYGWLIDRTSGYRLVFLYWVLVLLNCGWLVYYTHSATGLAAAALIQTTIAPLFNAADIMVYRKSDPKYIGAVTSSCACIKGLMIGLVVWCSGYLIDHTGTDPAHPNYRMGFVLGAGTATIGFMLIMLHGWLSRERKDKSSDDQVPSFAAVVPVPAQNQV